tara:strand:+ start:2753 stop:2971 length:219 start_codon:yes stop_codon:yes gene_type:complete
LQAPRRRDALSPVLLRGIVMMERSVMLGVLMAVVLLVSSNVGMAQSDRDLMNDAIELIQRGQRTDLRTLARS